MGRIDQEGRGAEIKVEALENVSRRSNVLRRSWALSSPRSHPRSHWLGKSQGIFCACVRWKGTDEISVPGFLKYTFGLTDGVSYVREGAAKGVPILRVEMPLDTFKDMILTKQRVIWALADPRNKVECMWPGVAYSDWITTLELLVIGQEVVERNPAMWDLIEDM